MGIRTTDLACALGAFSGIGDPGAQRAEDQRRQEEGHGQAGEVSVESLIASDETPERIDLDPLSTEVVRRWMPLMCLIMESFSPGRARARQPGTAVMMGTTNAVLPIRSVLASEEMGGGGSRIRHLAAERTILTSRYGCYVT